MIVLWIMVLLCCWMKVFIDRCFVGVVVIIDKLCIFDSVIFKVFGIGVVVSVNMFILVWSDFSFFFWWILNLCFLLIIIRFRLLNFNLLESSLWVFIIMFIFFLVMCFIIFFCVLLLIKWFMILILNGYVVNWFLKFLWCCWVSRVVGINIVICLFWFVVRKVVCMVIFVFLKFMLLYINLFMVCGCFILWIIVVMVCVWLGVFLKGKLFVKVW